MWLINKISQHWICITQWNSIFQMTNAWCYISCILIKKNFFQSASETKDINVIVQKVYWYGFRFHIAANFKKLPLFIFWYSIIGWFPKLFKKLLKYSFLFQIHTCVRLDFLHIIQPKWHTKTDWMEKQIWESSYFLMSQTFKK